MTELRPDQATRPPATRRSVLPLVLAGAAVLVAAVAVGATVLLTGGEDPPAGATATATATVAPTAQADLGPTGTDFVLSVQVLSRECVASAGCHAFYEVVPTYIGARPLDPGRSYLVKYRLLGLKSGPVSGNLTINGDQVQAPTGESGWVESAESALTAQVVGVTAL